MSKRIVNDRCRVIAAMIEMDKKAQAKKVNRG